MSGRSVVIGFAIAWAAYSLMFTGYAWLRGYDISFREIVAPVNFYQGTWPPPAIPDTQIFPGQGSGGGGGSSAGTAPVSPARPSPGPVAPPTGTRIVR